jgi:glycosyltransferase involved in cell wall biosynthesis
MTASRVKVSVVIKALNEESNIRRAIESSLTAAAPFGGEVIVADSGSTDRTVEIASAFPVTVVQLAHPEERCCGISPQLGYQHSHGDYVYLLDGDMDLNPAFVDRAIRMLDADPGVAGVGGYIGEMLVANFEFEQRDRRLVDGRLSHPAEAGHLAGGGLYRRTAIDDVRYLSDRNLHANEEYDLGVRLRSKGWRLIRLEDHAADHYAYNLGSYRLLLHRAKSGYILGSGEVLRAALDGGYLARVLRELRPIRAYGFAVALWLAVLTVVVVTRSWFWSIVMLAASLRHRIGCRRAERFRGRLVEIPRPAFSCHRAALALGHFHSGLPRRARGLRRRARCSGPSCFRIPPSPARRVPDGGAARHGVGFRCGGPSCSGFAQRVAAGRRR